MFLDEPFDRIVSFLGKHDFRRGESKEPGVSSKQTGYGQLEVAAGFSELRDIRRVIQCPPKVVACLRLAAAAQTPFTKFESHVHTLMQTEEKARGKGIPGASGSNHLIRREADSPLPDSLTGSRAGVGTLGEMDRHPVPHAPLEEGCGGLFQVLWQDRVGVAACGDAGDARGFEFVADQQVDPGQGRIDHVAVVGLARHSTRSTTR